MEQTTDGTISYRLSISRSHRSASSDNPSSGLADVMVREVSAGRTGSGAEGWRGGAQGRLDQGDSPIELCRPAKAGK